MIKRNKNRKQKKQFSSRFALPPKAKRWILSALMFLLSLITFLGFFSMAGTLGRVSHSLLFDLVGKSAYLAPFILLFWAFIFLSAPEKFYWLVTLNGLLLIIAVAGVLGTLNEDLTAGGALGRLISAPLIKLVGFWVTQIVFLLLFLLSGAIFWLFLRGEEERDVEPDTSLIRKIFQPKFKVSRLEPEPKEVIFPAREAEETPRIKPAPLEKSAVASFPPLPLELLKKEKEKAHAGDIKLGSQIIKKTLENFGIEVTMTGVNVGPTVTQYTLKPSEGVKLSKITGLSNNLALALAAHPIRIEAPIPGLPLVGVEIPNKVRSRVCLRNLFVQPEFQNPSTLLTFALGRDVAGKPVFEDLSRLPHLLVAGSTGSGKTIFLNSLILSLLYKNSPRSLRLILIDPKRVEFPIYNDLPHLLSPVIYQADRAINALKWLTGEMEKRFDLLSQALARDIVSYNQKNSKEKGESMPYIVLIIDELADLMAARGRELEAGIVRLAQMARAVGIHLVVATQRPSVEVITGLIKANITSRISFQVASQFDARTVLDGSGSEKLLGAGDMLYISAENIKPKRIQAAYVSEGEVQGVVNWIKEKGPAGFLKGDLISEAITELQEGPVSDLGSFSYKEEPLYEEAERLVLELRKASASLLQRRLRIGYARAARLLDMLEERGIVGPAQGAKAREVYGP